MVDLLDFLVFEVGDSLVVSVDSLAADLSVFAEDFFELLFSELLLFSVLLVFGLVALSAAGLLEVDGLLVLVAPGDLVVVAGAGDREEAGDGFTLALVAGVMVAAAEGDAAVVGVIVAAGLALAFVEAAVLDVVPVVPVVVPVVVVPVVPVVVVALTPKVDGTVTP